MTVRIGLVGTGGWAGRVHAPALAAAPEVEFAGVWGRSESATDAIAGEFGVPSFRDLDALAAEVDAVAFAVPPSVQAELAVRVAAHGRMLLLEKPVATTVAEAERLAAAVAAAGVRSVVFTTRLFDPVRVAWLREAAAMSPIEAHAEFVSGALSVGAYQDSAWRQVSGALWDVGPHVLSQLCVLLGPVEAVAVDEAVPSGDIRLRFEHERGRATAHLNLHADADRLEEWIRVGAPDGAVTSPPAGASYPESFALALDELLHPSGDPIRAGAGLAAGVETVRVLATAQALVASGRLGILDAVRERA